MSLIEQMRLQVEKLQEENKRLVIENKQLQEDKKETIEDVKKAVAAFSDIADLFELDYKQFTESESKPSLKEIGKLAMKLGKKFMFGGSSFEQQLFSKIKPFVPIAKKYSQEIKYNNDRD